MPNPCVADLGAAVLGQTHVREPVWPSAAPVLQICNGQQHRLECVTGCWAGRPEKSCSLRSTTLVLISWSRLFPLVKRAPYCELRLPTPFKECPWYSIPFSKLNMCLTKMGELPSLWGVGAGQALHALCRVRCHASTEPKRSAKSAACRQ